jgi:CBS domain-containing protein
MQIKHILATKGVSVITIRPEQTLRDAVAALAKHRIGALVVVNEKGLPVGIISERDIIRAASQNGKFFDLSVKQVMTTNVTTGSPQDDLKSVEKTMTERRFRHLPIVDEGKLAGIISIGDVVKAMVEEYQGEIDTLQTYIKG